MKTLAHHVLIFDEDCPLCRAYTGAFVKTKMLDTQGREAYQHMSEATCTLIDKERARNEIALVNTKTGQVIYGTDSLMRILGNAWPLLTPLFSLSAFKWLTSKMYSFISYNRKVIMPAPIKGKTCNPDLNLKYRTMYIVFTWLFTSLVLTRYSSLLVGVIPVSRFLREFIICGGQIVFQSLALWFIAREKRRDYLGNMMTISFAGAFLLAVILLVATVTKYSNPLLFTGIFLLVAALMFLEHWRRMKLLEIHWSASISWVLYRIIILFFIL